MRINREVIENEIRILESRIARDSKKVSALKSLLEAYGDVKEKPVRTVPEVKEAPQVPVSKPLEDNRNRPLSLEERREAIAHCLRHNGPMFTSEIEKRVNLGPLRAHYQAVDVCLKRNTDLFIKNHMGQWKLREAN